VKKMTAGMISPGYPDVIEEEKPNTVSQRRKIKDRINKHFYFQLNGGNLPNTFKQVKFLCIGPLFLGGSSF